MAVWPFLGVLWEIRVSLDFSVDGSFVLTYTVQEVHGSMGGLLGLK